MRRFTHFFALLFIFLANALLATETTRCCAVIRHMPKKNVCDLEEAFFQEMRDIPELERVALFDSNDRPGYFFSVTAESYTALQDVLQDLQDVQPEQCSWVWTHVYEVVKDTPIIENFCHVNIVGLTKEADPTIVNAFVADLPEKSRVYRSLSGPKRLIVIASGNTTSEIDQCQALIDSMVSTLNSRQNIVRKTRNYRLNTLYSHERSSSTGGKLSQAS